MNKDESNENNKLHPRKKGLGKILPGIILIFLGVIFLLDNYGFATFDIGKLWPLFLIVPGIFILLDYYKKD